MRKREMFVVLIFSTCTVAQATDNDVAALYLNKDYWAHIVWTDAPSSALWQLGGWEPFTGKQSDYATFTKKRKLIMLGMTLDAKLAHLNNRHINHHFTSLYQAGISKTRCDATLKEIVARFGKPVTHDGTVVVRTTDTSFVRFADYEYQWDLNDTRVIAACNNSGIGITRCLKTMTNILLV
jgi:hypothetical protein